MQKYILPARSSGGLLAGGFLLLVALLMTACHGNRGPDLSRIVVKVRVDRFDRDLFRVDTNQVSGGLRQLERKYPVFLPVYLSSIMNYGPYSDTSQVLDQELRTFLAAREVRQLEDTVNAHFPDLTALEGQLELAFRYTRYYFPNFRPPHCISFVSALSNYGAVTVDTVLAIGLDMFLGPAYPFYSKVSDPYPQYMIRQFAPRFMAADCMKAIQQELFPPLPPGKPLIQQMIDKGRQLYFLDRVMPGAPDSDKIGYTGPQIRWCQANEQLIWQYFIQNNLLFSTDMEQDMHFIGDGPSTQGLPDQAPGNIGSWIGWQIVRNYMKRNPSTPLSELMGMSDLQKILEDSHYRPG